MHLRLFTSLGGIQSGRVSDVSGSTMVILISALLGVGVIVMLGVFAAARTLGRIEKRLIEIAGREGTSNEGPSMVETSAGGAFEAFLSEEPGRKQLSKSEQFAAYRKWRQDKGLNWTNS